MFKFMPNIFKSMNRKQKREFDKLDKDKKAELLKSAIIDKVSGTMSQEIAKSMISGMELEREQIYQKFVVPIDSLSETFQNDEWNTEIKKLLSYLRMEHIKYKQKQMKNMKDDVKNED